MDDRRIADEQFRRELAERLKAIETRMEILLKFAEETKAELGKAKMDTLDLRYTLFGGPKSDDIGLLERFRKETRRIGYLLTLAMAVIAFLGKLISPIYDKLVSDWANKHIVESERLKREMQRPRVKVYKVYPKKGDPQWDPGNASP